MRNTLSVSRENRSSPSPGGTPANPRRREISSPNFDLKIREMEKTELADRPEEVFAFLELELSDGEQIHRHCNDHFFTEYKHCELLEAEIASSFESLSPDGTEWKLTLHARHPAFYVFAELRGYRTVFSDNSFTLLPDRPRELTFRLDSPVRKEDLEQALVVYDLRSSYSE